MAGRITRFLALLLPLCSATPAFAAFYKTGKRDSLERYSGTALRRTWQVQRFAADMCTLLHRFPDGNAFTWRVQRERLEYMTGTPTGIRTYAESFVGLPFDS